MGCRVTGCTNGSGKIHVAFDVVGDAGEQWNCEGVKLGSGELVFSKDTDFLTIARAVREEAAALYLDLYAAWALLNDISDALVELG